MYVITVVFMCIRDRKDERFVNIQVISQFKYCIAAGLSGVTQKADPTKFTVL